jgi:hypothetical protein
MSAHLTPTRQDLARDLVADLELAKKVNSKVLGGVYPWMAAIRRAVAAEARAAQLEDAIRRTAQIAATPGPGETWEDALVRVLVHLRQAMGKGG